MGDFNYNFTGDEKFFLDIKQTKRELFGISREKNCCINDLGLDDYEHLIINVLIIFYHQRRIMYHEL